MILIFQEKSQKIYLNECVSRWRYLNMLAVFLKRIFGLALASVEVVRQIFVSKKNSLVDIKVPHSFYIKIIAHNFNRKVDA